MDVPAEEEPQAFGECGYVAVHGVGVVGGEDDADTEFCAGVEESFQDRRLLDVDVVEVEHIEPGERSVGEQPGGGRSGGNGSARADLGPVDDVEIGSVQLARVRCAGREMNDAQPSAG